MFQFLALLFRPLYGWFLTLAPIFASYLGAAGSQFLVSLGVGVTVFSGFNLATSYLIGLMVSSFNSLPVYVLEFLGLIWFDKAINLLLSTGIFLLTVKGLRGDIINVQSWVKPGSKSGNLPG